MAIVLETNITKTVTKNNKFTVYEILCITNIPVKNNTRFSIHKRYSDFLSLHSKVSQHYNNLPPFPKKKWYKMDPFTIRERMILLDGYLKFLCQMILSSSVNDECKKLIIKFLEL